MADPNLPEGTTSDVSAQLPPAAATPAVDAGAPAASPSAAETLPPAAAAPAPVPSPPVAGADAAPPAAPAEPAKPAADSPPLPTDVPSAIAAAKAPDGVPRPIEAPKPADAVAAPPPAAEAAPPVYDFKFPEGIKPDADRLTQFTAFATENKFAPEVAQQLVDFHTQQMQDYATKLDQQMRDQQLRSFNDTRAEWRKEMLAEIGGEQGPTMGAIARMRDMLVPAEMLEARKNADGSTRPSVFEEWASYTGAGDHVVLASIFRNAARMLDEPQHSSLPANPKPPPTNGRAPGSRAALLYDNSPSMRRT